MTTADYVTHDPVAVSLESGLVDQRFLLTELVATEFKSH